MSLMEDTLLFAPILETPHFNLVTVCHVYEVIL